MSATIDSTIAPGTGREPSFSFVLEHPAADPAAANRHFVSRLAVETDPSDVKLDLDRGHPAIVVVDARIGEGSAKLGALGFRVKEMIGGLEYWRHEGSPVEGTEGSSAEMFG